MRFYSYVAVFGLVPKTKIFSRFFFSPGYALPVVGLNLAYFLIECYAEVRRTPDDLELTHYQKRVVQREKKWGKSLGHGTKRH